MKGKPGENLDGKSSDGDFFYNTYSEESPGEWSKLLEDVRFRFSSSSFILGLSETSVLLA